MHPPQESSAEVLKGSLALKQFIGKSEGLTSALKKVVVVAKTDVPVLIVGETGTGKELCARAIHHLSKRSPGPFVPVNCAAIPQELTENELFGHEPGAFTGSAGRRSGLIEDAEGGTFFLDEIDSLLPLAQSKFLRFLEEREFRPLGSGPLRRANVRVVAATNTDVSKALKEGTLREDLYYRLSVVQIELPSLRNRAGDIPLLADHFLSKWSAHFGLSLKEFSSGAISKLTEHDWPGNVRELENTIERTLLFSEGRVIEPSEIEFLQRYHDESPRHVHSDWFIGKQDLRGLLETHQGNISHAATAVGKSRKTIQRLIHKYEIDIRGLSSKAPH